MKVTVISILLALTGVFAGCQPMTLSRRPDGEALNSQSGAVLTRTFDRFTNEHTVFWSGVAFPAAPGGHMLIEGVRSSNDGASLFARSKNSCPWRWLKLNSVDMLVDGKPFHLGGKWDGEAENSEVLGVLCDETVSFRVSGDAAKAIKSSTSVALRVGIDEVELPPESVKHLAEFLATPVTP